MIKVRATCGAAKPMDTYFAHLLSLEKADKIKERISSQVEPLDVNRSWVLLYLIINRRSNEKMRLWRTTDSKAIKDLMSVYHEEVKNITPLEERLALLPMLPYFAELFAKVIPLAAEELPVTFIRYVWENVFLFTEERNY